MESYKEKLCEFLMSTPENISYSKEIFDLFQNGEIKEFIVSKYLDDFLVTIQDLINQSPDGWKSKIIKYPDETNIIIFKEEWRDLSISWSVLSNEIGLCNHHGIFESGFRSRINSYLSTTDRKDKMFLEQDNKHWLWWERSFCDVNDYNFLFKLTPSESEVFSIDLSRQLMSYSSVYDIQVQQIHSLETQI